MTHIGPYEQGTYYVYAAARAGYFLMLWGPYSTEEIAQRIRGRERARNGLNDIYVNASITVVTDTQIQHILTPRAPDTVCVYCGELFVGSLWKSRPICGCCRTFENKMDYEQKQRAARRLSIALPNLKAYQAIAAKRAQYPDKTWARCLAYWGSRCAVCGQQQGFWHYLARDHWVPRAKGGEDGLFNIVPLCHGLNGCNNRKSDKLPGEWLRQRYGKRKAARIERRIAAYFEWLRQQDA